MPRQARRARIGNVIFTEFREIEAPDWFKLTVFPTVCDLQEAGVLALLSDPKQGNDRTLQAHRTERGTSPV